MKQKLLAALKTKYANLGLGEKAFDGVAALLAKTVTKEDEVENAVSGVEVESLLKAIQSSVDSERTKAATAAKELEDYKKAHPENEERSESSELTKLREDYNSQKAEFDRIKADYENRIKQSGYAALRDSVKEKAGELKVSNVPIWNDVVASVEVGDESTADSVLSAVKAAYEAKLKSYIGVGAAPYRGEGNNEPAKVTAEDRIKKAKEDAARVRNS